MFFDDKGISYKKWTQEQNEEQMALWSPPRLLNNDQSLSNEWAYLDIKYVNFEVFILMKSLVIHC